jgi:histidine phosphotransferase ChpT
LCHDLAGPVGAVGTGAELFAEEDRSGGGLAEDALALLVSSAAAASARLRVLRFALGRAGGPTSLARLREMMAEFLASPTSGGGALSLRWDEAADRQWEALPAKVLLNMVLLARDGLPRGGSIAVRGDEAGLEVVAEGPGTVLGPSAQALTATEVDGLGAQGVQGYYTALLAAQLGWGIECVAETGRIRFAARPQ